MRLLAFVMFRLLALAGGVVALTAVGKLGFIVYALLTVQGEFPDVGPAKTATIYGDFIFAPLVIAVLFAVVSMMLWRLSLRFTTVPGSGLLNHKTNI
jgi:hypothetical protein